MSGVPQTGMTDKVEPMPNEPTTGGSTDVGDVSWLTPTMGILIPAEPQGISVHTWMATASHGTSIGTKAAVTASKVLALTGADLLTDPTFRQQVKADFAKRTQGFTYKSPLTRDNQGTGGPARQHAQTRHHRGFEVGGHQAERRR